MLLWWNPNITDQLNWLNLGQVLCETLGLNSRVQCHVHIPAKHGFVSSYSNSFARVHAQWSHYEENTLFIFLCNESRLQPSGSTLWKGFSKSCSSHRVDSIWQHPFRAWKLRTRPKGKEKKKLVGTFLFFFPWPPVVNYRLWNLSWEIVSRQNQTTAILCDVASSANRKQAT